MPPPAVTVTVELPPLHRIGVLDESAVTALGWVIVAGRGRGAAIVHRSPCRSKSLQHGVNVAVASVRPGAARRRSPSPLNCRRCIESRVLDESAVTALGCVIVAGRGRGATIGICHRVGVSPRSIAERAVASVRPGAATGGHRHR